MYLYENSDPELDLLLTCVTRAVDLASEGAVGEGYRCLLSGLARTEAEFPAGDADTALLAARFRLALARYANRYGIRPD